MIVTLADGPLDVQVGFEATIDITLAPGIWQVRHRGQDVSVTQLRARLLAGHLYFAYPKGVARNRDGQWAAQERLLAGLLPERPAAAWAALPGEVRSALEDAYLLQRHEIPEQLGGS